jgi:hypothetical protein
METLDEIIEKHNQVDAELDKLFENLKFNDILEMKKSLRGNYENNKNKFLETKNPNCFNYFHFFEIYINILKKEKDFVLFSIKNNNLEPNIGKGVNNYIVSRNGYRWIKIISRNVEMINNSIDPDYYEDYCIMDEIEKCISDVTSMKYLPFDEKPELYIIFHILPNDEVCESIINLGIKKEIKIFIKSSEDVKKYLPDCNRIYDDFIDTINIDVNVIITICSELSHLNANTFVPPEIIKRCITGDAQTLKEVIENKNFIIEQLKKYKRRIICQTAYDKLMEFCSGVVKYCPKEVERIKTITTDLNIDVVPDKITPRIEKMNHPNKLANCVFGSGDYYRAITITAYESYINHAKQNRIHIVAKICKSVEFSEKFLEILKK